MAFVKTSIAFQKPRFANPQPPLEVGMKKEGKVWDGEKWVAEEEWQAKMAAQEVTDG